MHLFIHSTSFPRLCVYKGRRHTETPVTQHLYLGDGKESYLHVSHYPVVFPLSAHIPAAKI